MINFTPPPDWFTYKQEVLNNRASRDHRPLIESELYYKTLSPIEQQNFDKRARAHFADNLDMRNKSTIYLRDKYYWETK